MDELILVNVTSTFCCFCFILFVIVTYFSKKNMDNIENKIFKVMLLSNFFASLFSTILYISTLLYNYNFPYLPHLLAILLLNIGPVFVMSWFLFLTFYIFIISNENNEQFIKKVNNKSTLLKMFGILAVLSLLHLFNYRDIDMTTGFETDVFYVMSLVIDITLIMDIVLLIKNRKKYDKRKAFPIFVTIALSIISLVFGTIRVPISFFHLVMSIANYLLSQTIENPDLKLVNELTMAKVQAEKANNAKSDFLSSMSHELRTPLNAILGLSQLIESTNDWNEVKEDSKDITEASKKLLELVDGILDINSIDNNEIELNNIKYNPYEVFDDIERLANNRLMDKNIKFNMKISNDIPSALIGDKNKVRTIITNLITNAIKYTNEGFVEFEASCFIVKDKCNLRISVSDTGSGIKEEDLPYVFDKFYRSEENKDSDIGGTGLGLTITKSLVDLMEGKITVNSTYGEGTTFFVTLSQKMVEDNNTEIL